MDDDKLAGQVGFGIASQFVEQIRSHPFFNPESEHKIGKVDLANPESGDIKVNAIVYTIAHTKRPIGVPSSPILHLRRWTGAEKNFSFRDIKGRQCRHFLMPRSVVNNQRFGEFDFSDEQIAKQERNYELGRYSSARALRQARRHAGLTKVIASCKEPYSVLIKIKTQFEIKEIRYDAEMPLFLIPEIDWNSEEGCLVSTFYFQPKHTIFRAKSTKGFHNYHTISANDYIAATRDIDFHLPGWLPRTGK